MPTRIGIIGAETLLGKELAQVFAEAKEMPWGAARLHLLAAAPSAVAAGEHRLAALADEAALLDPLKDEALADLDLILLASAHAEARSLAAAAPARGAAIVLDVAAPPGAEPLAAVLRVPHPAARALAAVLVALAPLGEFAATALVLEPASERGMAALNELQSQSLQLLSLGSIPTETFGGQIAYNVKAELPEEIHPSLAEIQGALAADLRGLAIAPGGAARFPLPAVRLLQAPLFHAHVIALAARFAAACEPAAVARALRAAPLRYLGDPPEQPDVLSVAGESEIHVGALQPDPLDARSLWLQIAFDNLRVRALTALRLAAAAWEHRHAAA
ncbi:MAG TPA: Asd/ArgC dimerization domain-containing protein [Terriglobales bacterium]|nr:Asd/ArgC dimerization domain-containing protein [Terriglobales bacterium]